MFPTLFPNGGGVSKSRFLQEVKRLRKEIQETAGQLVQLQTNDDVLTTMATIATAPLPNQMFEVEVKVAGASSVEAASRTNAILINGFGTDSAGTATAMPVPILLAEQEDGATTLDIQFNVVGQSLLLQVIGIAATVVNWRAEITVTRVHSLL